MDRNGLSLGPRFQSMEPEALPWPADLIPALPVHRMIQRWASRRRAAPRRQEIPARSSSKLTFSLATAYPMSSREDPHQMTAPEPVTVQEASARSFSGSVCTSRALTARNAALAQAVTAAAMAARGQFSSLLPLAAVVAVVVAVAARRNPALLAQHQHRRLPQLQLRPQRLCQRPAPRRCRS
jgi:hypothetical protein